MEVVGAILFLISLLGLLASAVGMIKPGWVKMSSRKEVLGGLIGTCVFLVISLLLVGPGKSEETTKGNAVSVSQGATEADEAKGLSSNPPTDQRMSAEERVVRLRELGIDVKPAPRATVDEIVRTLEGMGYTGKVTTSPDGEQVWEGAWVLDYGTSFIRLRPDGEGSLESAYVDHPYGENGEFEFAPVAAVLQPVTAGWFRPEELPEWFGLLLEDVKNDMLKKRVPIGVARENFGSYELVLRVTATPNSVFNTVIIDVSKTR